MRTTLLVLFSSLIALLSQLALSSSSPELQELWRLALDIHTGNDGDGGGQNDGPWLPLKKSLDDRKVFTADLRGVLFGVDAENGTLLWSNPGHGDGTLATLRISEYRPDLLFAHFSHNIEEANLTWSYDIIEVIDTNTGATSWTFEGTKKFPAGTNFDFLSDRIIFFTKHLTGEKARGHRATESLLLSMDYEGNMLNTKNFTGVEFGSNVWFSATSDAISLGFTEYFSRSTGNQSLYTFDPVTFEPLCKWTPGHYPGTIGSDPIAVFQGEFAYLSGYPDNFFINLRTCETLGSIPTFGPWTPDIKILGGDWYAQLPYNVPYNSSRFPPKYNYIAKLNTSEFLTLGAEWNITLQYFPDYPYDDVIYWYDTPSSDDILIIEAYGRQAAYNKSTGAVIWQITEILPTAPTNRNPVLEEQDIVVDYLSSSQKEELRQRRFVPGGSPSHWGGGAEPASSKQQWLFSRATNGGAAMMMHNTHHHEAMVAPVFPVDNDGSYFMPNLQGWIAYNPFKNQILAVNFHKPIIGVTAFGPMTNHSANAVVQGGGFFIYGEVESGDLVAARYHNKL